MRAGKVDEAIAQLKKAVELDPKAIRPILTVGNLYLLKRDRKSAMEWYDKALAADPNAPEVHVARGNLFFASGERDEGEKEYRKAIELSKEKEKLRIALAEIYLYQGRMDDSEKELNAVIKEMNSQKARKVLAEIKLETGKPEEAKPLVDAILKENEKDLDGKYLKGRIALSEKRVEDAKALFAEVIKQDAAMARAHLYLGLADIQQGYLDVGKKEVQEAVRLEPNNVRARLVLGEIYLQSNVPEAAEKEALEVLQRNPSNVQASVLYGDSFLARKDWKKAEQVYESVIKQLPKSPLGYFKMGIARKFQGKPSEAAGYFSQAVERNPKDLTAVNEYIFALLAAKQADKAKKVLDEYVAKEPKNPLLWEMAGRFHLAMREPAEAETAFPEGDRTGPGLLPAVLRAGRPVHLPEEAAGGRGEVPQGDREEREERRRPHAPGRRAEFAGEDRRGQQGVPARPGAVAEKRAGGEQPRRQPVGSRRQPGRGAEIRPDRPGGGPGGSDRRGHPGVDLLQKGADRDRISVDFGRFEETGEKRRHPVSPRDGAVEEGEDEGGGGGIEGGAGAGCQFPRR